MGWIILGNVIWSKLLQGLNLNALNAFIYSTPQSRVTEIY